MNTILLSQVDINSIFGVPWGKTKGFADFTSVILFNAVAFAGVILFLLLLVGGIMMMAGAGSGDKEGAAKGKKAVTAAALGFIIIFVSYWIIVIAENIFGFSILNPSP